MNKADKIVFSRTLKKAELDNTRILEDNIAEEIKDMKRRAENDMTILGCGSIVTLFAQEGLIDEYQILVNPVILSDGTPIFKGIKHILNLN
jgi:dihydrofolate reductase